MSLYHFSRALGVGDRVFGRLSRELRFVGHAFWALWRSLGLLHRGSTAIVLLLWVLLVQGTRRLRLRVNPQIGSERGQKQSTREDYIFSA